jgi:large subunit GTPase 1
MTAEEVDRNEKNAFLKWRREIAMLENESSGRKVTPFEKNIEVSHYSEYIYFGNCE